MAVADLVATVASLQRQLTVFLWQMKEFPGFTLGAIFFASFRDTKRND
jgi:hypothetical protein